MAVFFQGYYDQKYWKGLEKRGFLDSALGLKIHSSTLLEPKRKFNEFAKKDSALYNTLKELRCPMYSDRIIGGIGIDDYEYSGELIDDYSNMLGDNFFGFQIHEWASNFTHDWHQLERIVPCDQWTEEGIRAAFRKEYPKTPAHTLEVGTMLPSIAANWRRPRTPEEHLKQITAIYKKYADVSGGRVVLVDSYAMAPKIAIANGVRLIMPEVGAQIPDARVQLAYNRGIAKAYNVPLGIYYESWGGSPFSTCMYQKEHVNEWNIDGLNYYFEDGAFNGGSSRSLQERLYIYSYMCGARYFADEWGTCNTFYDWEDFEVSPYGQVRLDFQKFMCRFDDLGEAYTPIAIVLPDDMTVFDSFFHDYNQSSPFYHNAPNWFKRNAEVLGTIFGSTDGMTGTEIHVLRNGGFPDVFDIIHASDVSALGKYEYLIDATGDDSFAKSHDNVISLDDIPSILDKLLPCKLDNNNCCTFNKNGNEWIVTVCNNSGVTRSIERGEQCDPSADAVTKITCTDGKHIEKIAGYGNLVFENGDYYAEIPAGRWIVLRIA